MNTHFMRNFIFQHMAIKGVYFMAHKKNIPLLTADKYPHAIKQLLTEMYAASAMLSAHLKMAGRLSIQIRGKAALLNYALIECRSEQEGALQPLFIKGLACHNVHDNKAYNLTDLTGPDGHLVITLEPDKGQRYQGVVPLLQESLAGCLEDYFVQSEQLNTHIQLANNSQKLCGFMVQRLPESQPFNQQAIADWELVHMLSTTLTEQELTTLTVEEILHRLFHEHDIQLFAARQIINQCDCSRVRSGKAITSLGKKEIDAILNEQESIVIDCQFCDKQYAFDKVDCHLLLNLGSLSDDTNNLH